MTLAFDTLGYAKHLRTAGVPDDQADAHAEAARDYIMQNLVTKDDLKTAREHIELSLTVRVGGMIIIATGILIAAMRYIFAG